MVHFRNLALAPLVLARMPVISVGGIGQFLSATSSWIIVMRIVSLYGSTAVAACTIGLRIFEFIWLPSWGLGNAAATLVGRNLGAGDTTTSTIINFVCFWLLQIPLVRWLANGMKFGPDGVFLAIVAAESLMTILAVIVFRRGKWQQQRA